MPVSIEPLHLNTASQRTCDKCGREYFLNSREIPRITINKKIDLDDLNSKDFTATPDFCEHCTNLIIDFMQTKNRLRFKINNNYQSYSISASR